MKTNTLKIYIRFILLFLVCIGSYSSHAQMAQATQVVIDPFNMARQGPDLRDCAFDCTTNAFSINEIHLTSNYVDENNTGTPLTNTSCDAGTVIQVYMIATIQSNRNSDVYHARVFADLMVGDQSLYVSKYLGTLPSSTSGETAKLVYGPFDWTCGTLLTLENPSVYWKTNFRNGPDENDTYDCGDYSNSQCQSSSNHIVSTPLAVQYEYSTCTQNPTTTVEFQSTTNGGTPPYSYTWNFDGGIRIGGTDANPIVTYDINGGPYEPSLKVTDSNNNTNLNLYSQILVFPAELGLITDKTDAACGSNDGSGSFTANGGTVPYTFNVDSNTTGATTFVNGPPSTVLSFTGANSGSITVTVTDDSGCTTQETITISVEDSAAPEITAPSNSFLEGCDESAITGLGFNASLTTITEVEFTNVGGSYIEANIQRITYQDVVVSSDNCSTVVQRTFVITDSCNRMASATQTITINDTTPPILVGEIPRNVSNINACINNVPAGPTAEEIKVLFNDTCSNVNITRTVSGPLGSDCEWVVGYIFNVTDDCGNVYADEVKIFYRGGDKGKPTFSVPADLTIECGQSTDPSFTGDVTDEADNCASGLNATYSDSTAAGSCGNETVITRTWTLTDGCNNTESKVQTITIEDNTDPTFTVPADVTIECDESTDVSNTGDVTDESDKCSTTLDATFSDAVANGSCPSESVITRTWTLTDECNNTTTQVQTITVQDTTDPTFTVPVDVSIDCQDSTDVSNTGDVTDEADNCSTDLEATYSDSVANGSCPSESVITRTWTLVDECGNSVSQVQTITVKDNANPTFTVPADVTVECEQGIDVSITGDVTDEDDNCSTDLDASFSDVRTDRSCPNNYTIARTWTLSDDCGNVETKVQTITVQDSTDPTLVTPSSNVQISCGEAQGNQLQQWLDSNGGAAANDNCGDVIWTNNYNGANSDCAAPVSVTFTATDACGNSVSTTATYAVQDNTPPTITVPASDLTVECDGSGNTADLTAWLASNAGAMASDDCSAVTFTNDFSSLSDLCGATGSATVTFTATDGCGNSATTSATFTIQDTTAPNLIGELPNNVSNIETCISDIPAGPSTDDIKVLFSDGCGDVNVEMSETLVGDDCEWIKGYIYNITDECGNAYDEVKVFYRGGDVIGPEFTLLSDLTVECNATLDGSLGEPTGITDNCSTEMNIEFEDSTRTGDCENNYVITRTWTVTDNCGNATSKSQTITVQDTTAPTITAEAASVTIACSDENTNALQEWLDNAGGAMATDNCGDVTWTNNYNGATSDCSAPVSVIFTATDACGNTATTTASYAIQDIVAPIIVGGSDLTVECDGSGNTNDLNAWLASNAGATSTDDCSAITWSNDFSSLSDGCGLTGSATVTFTATDGCGNPASVTATFTIEDTTAPEFTVPDNISFECNVDVDDLSLTGDVTDETDSCSDDLDATYSDSVEEGDCPNSFVITRTWTLTDDCNNTTTKTQTITVDDTTAPTFTVPTSVSFECDIDITDLSLTGDVTDEADNCSTGLEATYTDSTASGNCPNSYVVTRTWTLIDECDNTTTQVQTITVEDTTAPTFTVPVSISFECDVDITDLSVTGDVSDEADNCSSGLEATYTDSTESGDCPNSYVVTRTWTLTDECDNSNTQVQTITVDDNTAPTFTVPASVSFECDADINDLSVTGDVTDENDNCSTGLEATYTDSTENGNCPGSYVVTRTWTLTDECNNITTQVQTITVDDTTAPTFTVPASNNFECDVDVTDLSITGDVTDEADNCSTGLEATYTDSTSNGDCPGSYIITRTWTLTDECNNTTTQVQTITVDDTTAPTFTVPADVAVECDQSTEPSATGSATNMVDNCSQGLTATYSDEVVADETCPNAYVITRIWTVVDECLNEASQIQTITVQDTTAPLPTSSFANVVNVTCDQPIPDVPVLEFSDACSDEEITAVYDETSTDDGSGNSYVITRSWTVIDICMNQATYTQTINVNTAGSTVVGDDGNLCVGDDFSFDLFSLLPAGVDTSGEWTEESGRFTIVGSEVNAASDFLDEDGFTYDENDLRTYDFTYVVNSGACPISYSATITLDKDCIILPCDSYEISKAVTPNGDMYNQTFEITGLESCGFTIELQIFNRWGAMIFESNDYQNDWSGTASDSSVGGSNYVPTGTYYYVINIKDSGLKPITGPIYVATNKS